MYCISHHGVKDSGFPDVIMTFVNHVFIIWCLLIHFDLYYFMNPSHRICT